LSLKNWRLGLLLMAIEIIIYEEAAIDNANSSPV
jgi:hypothetical protein